MDPTQSTGSASESSVSSVSPASPRVGWFRYEIASDSWEWSDGVYQVHGLEPGQVVPTTALLLSHKHPDDRERAELVLRQVIEDGEHFIQRHQILDLTGAAHTVVAVGGGDFDNAGNLVAVHGYLIDLTSSIHRDAAELATDFVETAVNQRGDIDQAKGALMVAYGLSDDEAFAVLRWHSQHANIKIRDLASKLMTMIGEPEVVPLPPRRKISLVMGRLTRKSFVVPPELITVTQAELHAEPQLPQQSGDPNGARERA